MTVVTEKEGKNIITFSTHFIRMDYPIHIDTISMKFSILYLRVGKSNFYKMMYCVLEDVFILANSANPDEMPPYAAFHLGFHCLPK